MYINGSLDKGISIGEKSEISLNNIHIENSKYGLVIKDDSSLYGNNINLDNIEYGLALYRKKKRYKPPRSTINNIKFNNIRKNKILVEDNAKLTLDGKPYLN